jgi:hypothetical protein
MVGSYGIEQRARERNLSILRSAEAAYKAAVARREDEDSLDPRFGQSMRLKRTYKQEQQDRPQHGVRVGSLTISW